MDFNNAMVSDGNSMAQREQAANCRSFYWEGTRSNRMDPWNEYSMKLAYEAEKQNMSLYKQDVLLQKKYAYEQALMEQKLRYQNFLQMQSCTVYSDGKGNIIYAVTNPENSKMAAKSLLNVANYRSTILKTFYPKMASALQITWDNREDTFLTFLFGSEGIEPRLFLKKLKAQGILLLVASRAEKQAANALLAYSINSAEQREIPGRHGWNRMGNGNWHYADDEEKTFCEVVEDACS